jgi:tetrapyrrole methylase family protein/MazG family protein
MNFNDKKPLYKLKEIAEILRSENGCAWDKEQTPQSLKPYLIEETYELYDAIEENDAVGTREELGDVLYQVYAHAQIAAEEGLFTIDDVAEDMSKKLIHRHPHVFGNETVTTADEVSDLWERNKKKEKSHRESILDGVPRHLPALLKAYRIQQKVQRVGFDWEKIEDAIEKLHEEVDEFKEVIQAEDKEKMIDEAGDVLFSMVNLLRFQKINPEEALGRTNKKFMNRFKHIEQEIKKDEKVMEEMNLTELDIYWNESKKLFP